MCEANHPASDVDCEDTQGVIQRCFVNFLHINERLQKSYDLGSVQFIILKGETKVLHRLSLPRLDPGKTGREVFATWKPAFTQLGDKFLTDANGLALMERDVFKTDSEAFSASFYPVTASITAADRAGEHAFTIWNDRPQAGSVHHDGKIKLLIDRRTITMDEGGVNQKPQLHFDGNLMLTFKAEGYAASERSAEKLAMRDRDVLAFESKSF